MKIYKIFISKIIIICLKVIGIKINNNARILSFPKLKIKGKPDNIIIGNVEILGKVDIRNRENGKIVIEDHCKIESDCRFVSAREGTICIGSGSTITTGAILNGGGNISIGKNCILGNRITINANEHVFKKDKLIKLQGFVHKDVTIEDDCWFGTNVVINKGVTIKTGSVIGASSLVNKDTEAYSINVGIPAKKIGQRP